MAGEYFVEVYEGPLSAAEAFDTLRAQALYDYGHRGYTGTIAEKDSFEITHDMIPLEDARLLVWSGLLPNNKWGPAGCIPFTDKSGNRAGFIFYGWASA